MEAEEIIRDEEYLDTDLSIKNSSLFELENELKTHPQKVAKYHRWYAQSCTDVNRFNARLKFITALITDEYCSKNKISLYQRAEVRKTIVPLDKRFINAENDLNKALEIKDYMKGLVDAWADKSYRLSELVKLADRLHFNEPKVYGSKENTLENRLDRVSEQMDFGDE